MYAKKYLIMLIITWQFPFFPSFTYLLRRVKSTGQEFSKILTFETEEGKKITVGLFNFPDGEIGLRILNPEDVLNSSIRFTHSLNSSQDFVETILLLGTLRQYMAANIELTIDGWSWDVTSDEDRYLLQMFKLFAHQLNVSLKGKKGIEFNISLPAISNFGGERKPFHVDEVLYIQERFKDEAENAAEGLKDACASQIIVTKNENFHWRVSLPQDLRDKNIVLIHSTENAENIIKLLLTLFKLREAGVRSISLINAYQGYARQDKEFKSGEGISAYTILKLLNLFLDYNFPINVHYGKRSGVTWLSDRKIYIERNGQKVIIQTLPALKVNNLNGFVQLTEGIIETIIEREGENGFLNYLERYPLVFISPDDGSKDYVAEAKNVLQSLLSKRYPQLTGREFIKVGYLAKRRLSPEETEIIGEKILDLEGNILDINYNEIANYWIGILDDETATGGTLKKAMYHLVTHLGAERDNIFIAVVHGKFVYGLDEFFHTKEKEMLPSADSIFVLDTLPLQDEVEDYNIRVGFIFPLIRYAIKRILGRPIDHSWRSFEH